MPFDTGMPWIKTGGGEGQRYAIATSQAKQRAGLSGVMHCARNAGEVVITAMQDLIYTSPELDEYADVAERLQVWDDGEQVWVGVRPEDPILAHAQEMETLYPVLQSSLDLMRQTGKALEAFERCLSEQAF